MYEYSSKQLESAANFINMEVSYALLVLLLFCCISESSDERIEIDLFLNLSMIEDFRCILTYKTSVNAKKCK